MFSRRAVRERFRRAPWAFAFSLLVMLLASIPLYLLKIEMIRAKPPGCRASSSSCSSPRRGS